MCAARCFLPSSIWAMSTLGRCLSMLTWINAPLWQRMCDTLPPSGSSETAPKWMSSTVLALRDYETESGCRLDLWIMQPDALIVCCSNCWCRCACVLIGQKSNFFSAWSLQVHTSYGVLYSLAWLIISNGAVTVELKIVILKNNSTQLWYDTVQY